MVVANESAVVGNFVHILKMHGENNIKFMKWNVHVDKYSGV
jgi:hypothetical protein